jgi:hypothetical protein
MISDTPLPHVDPTAVGHWFSLGGLLAALLGVFGLIPIVIAAFAGLAAGTYYTVLTLQTPPINQWLMSRRERVRAKQIAKLQYKQSLLVSEMKKLGLSTHAEVSITDNKQTTTIETHATALADKSKS